MNLAYIFKLSFKVQKTDVKAQKNDNSLLKIYKMVIAALQVLDKLGRIRFFQEIFLLANTSINMILKMSFFIFSNTNIQFAEKKLI